MTENTTDDGSDSTRRHPPSSYNAQYPYNQKFVSRSGHEVEFDDTPDATRVRVAHGKSGTYIEVSDSGKRVDMTTGKQVIYAKQGITTTADGNLDYKIGGSERKNISGDSHAEVAGDQTKSVGGSETSLVGGDSTSAVHGDLTMGITGAFTGKFGGGGQAKFDCGSAGGQSNVTLLADNDINVESATKIFEQVADSTVTIIPGSIALNTGGTITLNAGQSITLTVGESSITITGDKIIIDSPEVLISKKTYIGLLEKGVPKGDLIETIGGVAIQAWAQD